MNPIITTPLEEEGDIEQIASVTKASVGQLVEVCEEPSIADLVALEQEEVKNGSDHVEANDNFESGSFYFKALRQHRVLNRTEVIELYRRIRSGDDGARDQMIMHNLRLVLHNARRYKDWGLSMDDLIQEGTIGLMKAVERFDPDRGFTFSTFANWWIRQSISRSLQNQGSQVRLPTHVHEIRHRIKKVASELQHKLGHRPSIQDIARQAECSEEKVIEAFQGFGKASFSFDEEINHNGEIGSTHGELFPDEKQEDPSTILILKEGVLQTAKEIKLLLEVLETIPDHQTAMFRMFYGLTDESVRLHNNLEIVGLHFGITRERVRQIVGQVWRTVKSRCPDLKIDREILTDLRQDMTFFETIWEEVKAQDNIATQRRKPKSILGINKEKAQQVKHMRASPAFIKWSPSENGLPNGVKIIKFVSSAYEVPEHTMLGYGKQNKESIWSRRVCVFLMSEVKVDLETEKKRFWQLTSSDISSYRQIIAESMQTDQLIRRDIEGMLRHLEKQLKP